jgi:hypothetical protein
MKQVAVISLGGMSFLKGRGPLALVLLVLPALLALPALAQQSELETRANMAFSLAQSEISRVYVQGLVGEPVVAVLDLHGRPVVLQLAPHSVRAAGFQLLEQRADQSWVEVDPGPVTTYRGTIVELPGSRVAAGLTENGLYARFFLPDVLGRETGGEELWLEPLFPRVAGATPEQHVLYHREDVICAGDICGADLLPGNVPAPVPPSDPVPPSGGYLTAQVAELACDGAYQFYQYWGGSVAGSNQIQSVIGAMNLQYETEVGMSHEITTILIRTSPNQPYTSNDAFTLFEQFKAEWNANQTWVARDVAQLFSGPIPGGIAGIGAIGSVCRPSEAYSFVQGGLIYGQFQCSTDLSAHELGHNWNATHCPCPDSTMNAGITCTNTFSPVYSRPEIIAYRDSVGCLDSGGGAGPMHVLLSDGFENGSLAAGGWTAQNGNVSLAKNAARSGAKGVRLKQTTWVERAVNTTGFPVIRLEYSRRTAGYEASERLFVEWWDGAAWQLVESTGASAWGEQSVLLDAAAGNNAAFKVRFRTNANMNNETADVDNVRVIDG